MYYLYRNLIEKYPLYMWVDLINHIRGLSCIRTFIKGDDFTLYLIKDFQLNTPNSQDQIALRITKKDVSMEIQYKKDHLIKDFHKLIFETPLEQVALYTNTKKNLIKKLVMWRLENNM
jgi:hypothetical protein